MQEKYYLKLFLKELTYYHNLFWLGTQMLNNILIFKSHFGSKYNNNFWKFDNKYK
jgi:Zn-dependent metalloprotease